MVGSEVDLAMLESRRRIDSRPGILCIVGAGRDCGLEVLGWLGVSMRFEAEISLDSRKDLLE